MNQGLARVLNRRDITATDPRLLICPPKNNDSKLPLAYLIARFPAGDICRSLTRHFKEGGKKRGEARQQRSYFHNLYGGNE